MEERERELLSASSFGRPFDWAPVATPGSLETSCWQLHQYGGGNPEPPVACVHRSMLHHSARSMPLHHSSGSSDMISKTGASLLPFEVTQLMRHPNSLNGWCQTWGHSILEIREQCKVKWHENLNGKLLRYWLLWVLWLLSIETRAGESNMPQVNSKRICFPCNSRTYKRGIVRKVGWSTETLMCIKLERLFGLYPVCVFSWWEEIVTVVAVVLHLTSWLPAERKMISLATSSGYMVLLGRICMWVHSSDKRCHSPFNCKSQIRKEWEQWYGMSISAFRRKGFLSHHTNLPTTDKFVIELERTRICFRGVPVCWWSEASLEG